MSDNTEIFLTVDDINNLENACFTIMDWKNDVIADNELIDADTTAQLLETNDDSALVSSMIHPPPITESSPPASMATSQMLTKPITMESTVDHVLREKSPGMEPL
jgi:hypothetical protein